MKTSWKYITLVLAISLLAACEVIPEGERLIPVETEKTNRKILLVEFSGVKCNNCPIAAEEGHKLQHLYGEKLVIVEMHPASNALTNGGKNYDYTCPEADEYYKTWGLSILPAGVINMTTSNGSYHVPYQEWGAVYQQAARKISPVEIEQQVEIDDHNNLLIDAEIQNLYQDELNLKCIVWLTEDSIVGAQVLPDGSKTTEYQRNHLMRDAITQTWGEAITLAPNNSVSVKWNYTLPENVVAKNCNIICIVLKDNEAIQVNEYKLNKIIK